MYTINAAFAPLLLLFLMLLS